MLNRFLEQLQEFATEDVGTSEQVGTLFAFYDHAFEEHRQTFVSAGSDADVEEVAWPSYLASITNITSMTNINNIEAIHIFKNMKSVRITKNIKQETTTNLKKLLKKRGRFVLADT